MLQYGTMSADRRYITEHRNCFKINHIDIEATLSTCRGKDKSDAGYLWR